MPRNLEKDAKEEKRRREQLIKSGFKLFSSQGIESVSLQAVATDAKVGIATLFNYYQNKLNLVVAISAYLWENVWSSSSIIYDEEALEKLTAYDFVDRYCDRMIDIYINNPEILKFSGNYKTYISREHPDTSVLSEHLNALQPLEKLFHKKFEQAKIDGSIRTDIPEKELFTTVALTMLGAAERYAMGIVWANNQTDHLNELNHVKEMLLMWVKKQ